MTIKMIKKVNEKDELPRNSKLVFKGILFNVYQWKQKQFDGSFKIFEVVKRKPSVQIIVTTKNKKILLLKEEQPFVGKFTGLVGGQVENDETPEKTAKKELLEETGMKAEELTLWKKESFSSKVIWDTYYFIAKNCTNVQTQNLDAGEKITPIEVDFETFINMSQDKNFRNKNFSSMILEIKNDEKKLTEFRKTIF